MTIKPIAKAASIKPVASAAEKAKLAHVNAIILALHDSIFDLVNSKCPCSTCELIRKNMVHLKAVFSTSTAIKKIKAA